MFLSFYRSALCACYVAKGNTAHKTYFCNITFTLVVTQLIGKIGIARPCVLRQLAGTCPSRGWKQHPESLCVTWQVRSTACLCDSKGYSTRILLKSIKAH